MHSTKFIVIDRSVKPEPVSIIEDRAPPMMRYSDDTDVLCGETNFQTRLFIDMMTNISYQLPSIDIASIRFHMMRPEFKQIILTGEVDNPNFDVNKLNEDERLSHELTVNSSKFLAGCLFKVHKEDKFVELIYFVVNPNFQRLGLGK